MLLLPAFSLLLMTPLFEFCRGPTPRCSMLCADGVLELTLFSGGAFGVRVRILLVLGLVLCES